MDDGTPCGICSYTAVGPHGARRVGHGFAARRRGPGASSAATESVLVATALLGFGTASQAANAVGFIKASQLDDSVKVIRIDGNGPGQPAYKLRLK